MISTMGILAERDGRAAKTKKQVPFDKLRACLAGLSARFGMTDFLVGAHDSAQQYEPSVRSINATFGARILRQPRTEDKKLRKDPLEVLALKVPFGRQSTLNQLLSE